MGALLDATWTVIFNLDMLVKIKLQDNELISMTNYDQIVQFRKVQSHTS
jgi:hypothetical protein